MSKPGDCTENQLTQTSSGMDLIVEHLRLKEEECKQLQQDKAELVEFVNMIANGKTECGESAIIHTRIHADEAKELLEKHK